MATAYEICIWSCGSTRPMAFVNPVIDAMNSTNPNKRSVIARANRIWLEAVRTREYRQNGTMTNRLKATVKGARKKAKKLKVKIKKVSWMCSLILSFKGMFFWDKLRNVLFEEFMIF